MTESATARIFIHAVPLVIVTAYRSDQMRRAKNVKFLGAVS